VGHDDGEVGQRDEVDERVAAGCGRSSGSVGALMRAGNDEHAHVRLLGKVEVGARVLDLLGVFEIAHNLLEQRQARQEANDLLLGPLDAVLLRRDCPLPMSPVSDMHKERGRGREGALRSKRSLARLYSSRSCLGGPASRAEPLPSSPARPSTDDGRLPFLVKMVSRKVRLRAAPAGSGSADVFKGVRTGRMREGGGTRTCAASRT